MLRMTAMAKDDTVTGSETASAPGAKDSVKVRLSLSKTTARKLGRVTRWERKSEGTSLELTGRS